MTIENHDSTRIRPAIQLSGTWNITGFEGGASQTVTSGGEAYMKATSYERTRYGTVRYSTIVGYRSASVGVSEKLIM